MEAIAIGIAIIVGSAAIIGAFKWLQSPDNRETAKQWFCRHEWEPIPDDLISPYAEWCRKCNARR